MKSFLAALSRLWATNSPVRHAVGAFLAVELAPYLTQIYDWSVGNGALPDWGLVAHNLGKAIVGAIVLGLLRWLQRRKPATQPVAPQ